MKYSTLIEDMITEGATPEMILVAVRAVERQETDALERRRAADRARQDRHRSRDITLAHVSHGLSRSHASAEDRTSNLEIEPQVKKQNAPSRDVDGFISELSSDVPSDLLAEFVKVRRRKRGALTAFAARLFRDDAAKVSMSVAEAATECVRSSWITVKPEYFAGRQRGPPQTKAPSQADVFKLIRTGISDGQGREDRGGIREIVSNLPAVRTG